MATKIKTDGTAADDANVSEILDTIGDEMARRILAAINREPRSASELNEALDLSLPTIYRRTSTLEDNGLVTSETRIGPDGGNYKVFKPAFDATVISLEDEVYDVRLYREGDTADRFAALWDDLGR